MAPAAAVTFKPLVTDTWGLWLAPANVGVTVHFSRAAKSRCANSNQRAVA